ncbi:hypothetical protein [Alicyclobacillus vulcanalis]|uniref:Uncharacterized protein n=1 Tax=Alicyclobacillus vulcanalis TaxID=252246 RepID=A0A1N7MC22_9BACL|nr:hypothetical protein [Alicyclobacillus vulcanalis]SIS83592.1 hypothetical protein SAMN05421799_10537 [Alicyclobacillus vulcanalis]
MIVVKTLVLLLFYAALEFGVGLLFAWAFGRMFQVRLPRRVRLWMAAIWALLGVIPTLLGIQFG